MEYITGFVIIAMALTIAYLWGRVEALKADLRNRPPSPTDAGERDVSGKTAVRFADAWCVAAIWFVLDGSMKLFGEKLPTWAQFEVDLNVDFMIAAFLVWLWVAFRFRIPASDR